MILNIYLEIVSDHPFFLYFFNGMVRSRVESLALALAYLIFFPRVAEARVDPAVLRRSCRWPQSVGLQSQESETLKTRKLVFESLAIGQIQAQDMPITAIVSPSDDEEYYDPTKTVLTDDDPKVMLTNDDLHLHNSLTMTEAVLTDDNLPNIHNSPILQTIDEELYNDFSFDGDDSVLMMDNDIPCSCDSPSLQSIEILVGRWQKSVGKWPKEWPSEDMWNEAFNKVLARAQAKGKHALFLEQCAEHASEGRSLLDTIKDTVHTHCPCCKERLKYDIILLYDLLVGIISEVEFFEVKLLVDTDCD
ncbi:hypothetical protein DFJ58DRAFT_840909 [Suillus subalutaceus]|uniref:uncharacterized protein n=1 Tax=Suillus subalutaceus TaxID=48586 RepID=UPI001B87A4FD|nr:uncharacterized protein DFJ58DRAFT_840909 [Suillus subalutaceus]KAG1856398.1 hypothetical protein DFJ58DRAFT_840909 [Suillus subalutaceus]